MIEVINKNVDIKMIKITYLLRLLNNSKYVIFDN